MARDLAGGSEHRIQYDSITNRPPLTLACWFNCDLTSTNCLMSVGSRSVSIYRHYSALQINAGANGVYASSYNSSTSQSAAMTSITYGTGEWRHGAAVFASESSRIAYHNGTASTEGTTTVTLNTLESLSIGSLHGRDGVDQWTNEYDGRIFWPAVWDVALTASEVASLAAGYCPLLVRPQSLIFFAPFGGLDPQGVHDVVAGATASINSSSAYDSDGPTGLIYPRRSLVGVPTGAPAISYTARQLVVKNTRLVVQ